MSVRRLPTLAAGTSLVDLDTGERIHAGDVVSTTGERLISGTRGRRHRHHRSHPAAVRRQGRWLRRRRWRRQRRSDRAAGKRRLRRGELGNDRITGGRGADTLAGGPGVNAYDAGPGPDIVDARNGTRELVRCGSGRDRARLDRRDRARSCERISRPG